MPARFQLEYLQALTATNAQMELKVRIKKCHNISAEVESKASNVVVASSCGACVVQNKKVTLILNLIQNEFHAEI